MSQSIRNICIIAHVDHGKTTLVDHLLRQAGSFKAHEELSDRVMDSMDLERERGITIKAKNASVMYQTTKINIVDTPGHADFGGEVERILGMADGALLLVDAAEGPLPQTRFVLQKALKQGLKVILVINKVDRPECRGTGRMDEVINQTFDLFVELGATDEQAEFAIVYTCARDGWCTLDASEIEDLIEGRKKANLLPLFDLIVKLVPEPKVSDGVDFQMLISNLGYSDYVGRLAIGRVLGGRVARNQRIVCKGENGDKAFNVSRLSTFDAMAEVEVEELLAGDIGSVAGLEEIEIGDTLCGSAATPALPRIKVDLPTIGMLFSVNTSPFSGKEGSPLQSRKLRERLQREVRLNVALRFQETDSPDQFRVLGRGELQFAILVEQMRREGSEFMIGKPLVLFQTDTNGQRLEPMERATLDLPDKFVGDVTSLFQTRKGILQNYDKYDHSNSENARVRLVFDIPTRGLLGIRSRFLTLTRGEGLMSTEFLEYAPFKGEILMRVNGAIIADREGPATEYAIRNLEDRGMFFIQPGDLVYEGMIVGESNKDVDINANVCREKKLTNMRASHLEALVHLAGVRKLSLEDCIEWIEGDEWIEITPKTIRIRKKVLAQNMRGVHRSEALA
jgi:GTP-binding protein